VRAPRRTRGPRVLRDHHRNAKSFLFAIVGAEYVLRMLPRGHARIRPLRAPLGARRLLPRRGALPWTTSPGMTYNPLARTYALRRRRRRELHRGMPAMIRAVLFDLDGTLADTAPRHGAHREPHAHSIAGSRPVPLEQVRPHVSTGARGMVCSAFGITTQHADFGAMREEFLELYGKNLCVDSRLFPGMDELLGSLESRAIAWGVVTNKHERFARPPDRRARTGHARPPSSWAAIPVRVPSPSRSPDLRGAAPAGRPVERALRRRRPALTCRPRAPRACRCWSRATATWAMGRPAHTWGADAIVESVSGIGEWLNA
jgi:phosphoglycolate phosphatase